VDPIAEFDLDPDLIYLNHAATAPWPRRTCEAVRAFAAACGRRGAADYPQWLAVEAELRERLARLINAPSAADIALLKNTSEGLSVVAHGLAWQAGDNLVSCAHEFPSNRLVWESLAPLGVTLRQVDYRTAADPEGALLAACDHRTRLVAVSSVQYSDGFRIDLERIGAHCRANDILFCVDAIQGLGALPCDVQQIQADFLAADGHKWLLGPEGIALFYAKPEARERLTLRQYGWHMVEQVGDFDRLDWQPARSARRFEAGSPNMLGIHALQASVSLLLEVGIERVAAAVLEHADELMGRIKACPRLELLSSPLPQRRSGIVTFRPRHGDPVTLYRQLMQQGIVCAQRGGGVRFSPHFYNRSEELQRALGVADDMVRRMGG
jgi:cysteine desulfurase / selenocysteine lyase